MKCFLYFLSKLMLAWVFFPISYKQLYVWNLRSTKIFLILVHQDRESMAMSQCSSPGSACLQILKKNHDQKKKIRRSHKKFVLCWKLTCIFKNNKIWLIIESLNPIFYCCCYFETDFILQPTLAWRSFCYPY